MPFPAMPQASQRIGHIYRTADSNEYIDGACLIHVVRNAAGWSVNSDGSLDVDLGRGSVGESGHVILRHLARRVGSAPFGLPDQAGDIYEVAGPKIPDQWRELTDRMLRNRDVELRELSTVEREGT
jgi:hypothetical protein